MSSRNCSLDDSTGHIRRRKTEGERQGTRIVGRFAPSPTGRMHLGNIASMLVAWLAAQLEGGRIVLRIEDIDLPRAVRDADRWIMDDLHWLGLEWDGEPIWQSQRLDLYRQALEKLEGLRLLGPGGRPSVERLVFPCFCSRKDLREASAPQGSDGFVIYPGTCRHYASNPAMTGPALAGNAISRRHSLRLAMPRPGAPQAVQQFVDACYGSQSWSLPHDIGDVVIRRSDHLFAYQLVVVIDDLLQGVTQIVRGRDLLRSTAVQMWIRRCLLAAREGDAFAQEYKEPVATNAPEQGRSVKPADGVSAETATGKAAPRGPAIHCDSTGTTGSQAPSPAAPMYLHTPLILGTDGKRLAKRNGSLEVATLREEGVPPDAVIGYLAAVLGLTPSHTADCSDFEPLSPQNLLELLKPAHLASRLRGGSHTPHDHVVDPQILLHARQSRQSRRRNTDGE